MRHTTSSALGRVTAYLSRLQWRGILAGLGPRSVRHHGSATSVVLELTTEDTLHPGEEWRCEITVRLPDDADETAWTRRLLEAIGDALGHELGEAIWLDGQPVASPHARPLIWPWRVTDRES